MRVDERIVEVAPQVRAALIGAYGFDAGCEAASEAVTWALEHRDRVAELDNVAGYLYRVGQTSARRARTPVRFMPAEPTSEPPLIEPGLVPALERLSEQQRTVVVMVHAFGWPQAAVADVLGVSASTVAAHLKRGMDSLRNSLEVIVDGR